MNGSSFRAIRIKACMSQAHLALAARVSERTIRRLEAGKGVGFETIRAVCAVLGENASRYAREDTPSSPTSPISGPQPWSDALIDRAVALWMSGESGGAIAQVLGNGFTKNRVICKMFRMGLAFRKGPWIPDDDDPLYPGWKPGPRHDDPEGCPA